MPRISPPVPVLRAPRPSPPNREQGARPVRRREDPGVCGREVRVDESRIRQIRNDDGVRVFLGSETASIAGTVAEISRAVDADARAFLVKIVLPTASALRSGE